MSLILNYINYFWKLGYHEETPDHYVKKYRDSYVIMIDLASESINYGVGIKLGDQSVGTFSQRNFVVLECVDRLLTTGYLPDSLRLGGSSDFDVLVLNGPDHPSVAFRCRRWEDEYDQEIRAFEASDGPAADFMGRNPNIGSLCIYTSRLKAGLIDYRNVIVPLATEDESGAHQTKDGRFEHYPATLLEEGVEPVRSAFRMAPVRERGGEGSEKRTTEGVFQIENDVLMGYSGTSSLVIVPEGIRKISSGVFWDCPEIREIIIPSSVSNLGGDTFCYCPNLARLTIPRNVSIIGDNPFTDCPSLMLNNESPHFVMEDGALYDRARTRLIYYPIKNRSASFEIPYSIVSIGKHAFYNCRTLHNISIPRSVTIIENNPFSNCPALDLTNQSPHFVLENGSLYDRHKSSLFYFAINNSSRSFDIPEGVRIIQRHAFYGCSNLSSLTIPSSVRIIGYNPFANCPSLSLVNHSPNYVYDNGVLYDRSKRELVYYSMTNTSEDFTVPKGVGSIGRSAFFGCDKLRTVTLPEGVEVISRSAFAKCTELRSVNIPSSVRSIDQWAFRDCSRLEYLSIPRDTIIGNHVFSGCHADITRS